MRPLRNLSIRFKLTASFAAVAIVVLLLGTALGLVEAHRSSKAALVTQMSALADVLGDASSTALQFEDETTANEVLALVHREPNVLFVQTFNAEGERFAMYKASQSESVHVPAIPDDAPSFFDDGFLHVSTQIGDSNAPLGRIYLRASMQDINASLGRRIRLAIFSLLVCLGVAVLLGFFVQRAISKPILQMAAATERVSREADYSARVQKHASDELGVLCDGFNEMLEQIQQRDRELEKHHMHLEDLVRERTSSLEAKTEQLTDANEQLERSNQELDDFAYIVSHDLKEPLRGISRYSAFLAEDYTDQLDDAGRDKLETLQRLCQRQEDLINSLLHYSRVGRADLAIQETDLNTVVDEVVEMMDVMLQERGVDVRLPQKLPAIRCDSVRIVEVFRNLITNAVKYNDKPEKWVEIGFQQHELSDREEALNEDGFVFYVRDNGIGIREKHQASVFRIFKRLHARDKYGGGTGAGLTFVKKILERHGGRIWLESTFGEGTTFYFTVHKGMSHDTNDQPHDRDRDDSSERAEV